MLWSSVALFWAKNKCRPALNTLAMMTVLCSFVGPRVSL